MAKTMNNKMIQHKIKNKEKVEIFNNEELNLRARAFLNPDGSISINAEDTAIGFGWIQTQAKRGKEYTSVRWERMNGFSAECGFPHKWGKDDYIPESLFYMLGFKAENERAVKYQQWLAIEVLPSIRKHGAYMTNEVIERTLTDPDYLIQLATALKEERQARKLAEEKIEEQKPLVDFANQVSDTTDLIDMKTMAKLLKDNNINIGRNRLFEFLRMKKILMKDNQPYQQYVDAGYFKVNEYTYTNSFGQTKTNRQTFVTGKGQLYITKKVKEFWAA